MGLDREQAKEALEKLDGLLERLPRPLADDLRRQLRELRELILEKRPPAFVLVGRRGAGKSSLVNALFGRKLAELGHVTAQTGEPAWFSYRSADGDALDVLDTRGVQEGSRPAGADTTLSPLESTYVALREKAPDAILFVVKATEVDAAIDADIRALERIADFVERTHGFRPPVVGVVSQCDLLEPKRVELHAPERHDPEEVREKQDHVATAENHLRAKLRAQEGLEDVLVEVLGVSAYLSFRADGTVRSDERWRIEALVALLFRELPAQGRVTFARLARVRKVQEEIAGSLTNAVAGLCAGIAATPIPIADIAPITSLQVLLIASIAWVSGRRLELSAAAEFLAAMGLNVSAAFALREAARALVKWVFPGAGSALSAGVAWAGTKGIGAAATAYYLRGLDAAGAREALERGRRDAGAPPEDLPG